jgi:ABC-2 type transport system ATP-binding protein
MGIIEVDRLTRNFSYYEKAAGLSGSLRNLVARKKLLREAVRGVSFSVREGEMVGFLGPNGAGKTTTLKMLSGIMHPSSGEARVMGFVPWQRKKDFRMRISIVMGQRSQLWPDLPAIESFNLNREIYEIDRGDYERTLGELVELFGVRELLKVQVRRLSLGERMKMELTAALLHRPEVLFLDEPTIGLDLLSQRAIRELVRTLNERRGTTVMLTSHYLSDIEELCERVILINRGSIVYDGPLQGVNATLAEGKVVKLVFSEPVQRARLEGLGGLRAPEGSRAGDSAEAGAPVAAVPAPALLEATFDVERDRVRDFSRRALGELPVADLTIEEVPLEEGIARLYRGDRADA